MFTQQRCRTCVVWCGLLLGACTRAAVDEDVQDLNATRHKVEKQVQQGVDKAKASLDQKLPAAREHLREELVKTRDEVQENIKAAADKLRKKADETTR